MVVFPGFMPINHYSGSDISRPEMGIMGIMNRARRMQIVENGFHVRMMFLLLGLLLSIVNLPIVSGEAGVQGPVPGETPNAPPPPFESLDPPKSAPSPAPSVSPPHPGDNFPPPPPPPPPSTDPPPPPVSPSVPPSSIIAPSPLVVSPSPPIYPPPPPTNTWNESEKAGVVIASIAALLQVAVVAFLLIKRHQMLTTVEYDDIDDLEYDTPRDSNFRDIESA